jgi:hypothetical protein
MNGGAIPHDEQFPRQRAEQQAQKAHHICRRVTMCLTLKQDVALCGGRPHHREMVMGERHAVDENSDRVAQGRTAEIWPLLAGHGTFGSDSFVAKEGSKRTITSISQIDDWVDLERYSRWKRRPWNSIKSIRYSRLRLIGPFGTSRFSLKMGSADHLEGTVAVGDVNRGQPRPIALVRAKSPVPYWGEPNGRWELHRATHMLRYAQTRRSPRPATVRPVWHRLAGSLSGWRPELVPVSWRVGRGRRYTPGEQKGTSDGTESTRVPRAAFL